MAKLEIGMEFWPWDSYDELMSYAAQAMRTYPYDYMWMCDEFQYEDTITILSAMALELDVSVGTLVTFPWRNPLELAQRFATMAKQTRPGKKVALGIGGGGAVQVQVIGEKGNPASVVRESVQLLRALLAGKPFELARCPELAARFRYNTTTAAKLYFPPPEPVPVYLAAGGPKMFEVAGQEADGVVFTQLQVRSGGLGTQNGFLEQDMKRVEAARENSDEPDRPYKRIYNFHLSVSRDGQEALQWAKRNTSYGLSGTFIRYPHVLDQVGLDRELIAHIAEAYIKGLGIEEAVTRVPDELVKKAGLVFCGTPEEVAEAVQEQLKHVVAAGFDHVVMGVPLGPDVPEALDLLGKEVIPSVVS